MRRCRRPAHRRTGPGRAARTGTRRAGAASAPGWPAGEQAVTSASARRYPVARALITTTVFAKRSSLVERTAAATLARMSLRPDQDPGSPRTRSPNGDPLRAAAVLARHRPPAGRRQRDVPAAHRQPAGGVGCRGDAAHRALPGVGRHEVVDGVTISRAAAGTRCTSGPGWRWSPPGSGSDRCGGCGRTW